MILFNFGQPIYFRQELPKVLPVRVLFFMLAHYFAHSKIMNAQK